MRFLSVLLIGSIFYSCTSRPESSADNMASSEIDVPISELTVGDIWRILLKENDAEGKEAPDGPYVTDALSDVVEIMTATCVQENCGYMMQIQNISSGIITVVMKFTFKLPGNEITEFIRAYDIGSMDKVNTGCTHFCYGGESFPVGREIISASYK